tara:strand:+ start:1544 stop:2050 length:507 start_codon:yes stop_codon:yes gene_type:complete
MFTGKHLITQIWHWEVKCPGTCEGTETLASYCVPKNGKRAGLETRSGLLTDHRNRTLTPEQIEAVKKCHKASRPSKLSFLKCVIDQEIVDDTGDLIDPVWRAGPPVESECYGWAEKGCECKRRWKWLPRWGAVVKGLDLKSTVYGDHSNKEYIFKSLVTNKNWEEQIW